MYNDELVGYDPSGTTSQPPGRSRTAYSLLVLAPALLVLAPAFTYPYPYPYPSPPTSSPPSSAYPIPSDANAPYTTLLSPPRTRTRARRERRARHGQRLRAIQYDPAPATTTPHALDRPYPAGCANERAPPRVGRLWAWRRDTRARVCLLVDAEVVDDDDEEEAAAAAAAWGWSEEEVGAAGDNNAQRMTGAGASEEAPPKRGVVSEVMEDDNEPCILAPSSPSISTSIYNIFNGADDARALGLGDAVLIALALLLLLSFRLYRHRARPPPPTRSPSLPAPPSLPVASPPLSVSPHAPPPPSPGHTNTRTSAFGQHPLRTLPLRPVRHPTAGPPSAQSASAARVRVPAGRRGERAGSVRGGAGEAVCRANVGGGEEGRGCGWCAGGGRAHAKGVYARRRGGGVCGRDDGVQQRRVHSGGAGKTKGPTHPGNKLVRATYNAELVVYDASGTTPPPARSCTAYPLLVLAPPDSGARIPLPIPTAILTLTHPRIPHLLRREHPMHHSPPAPAPAPGANDSCAPCSRSKTTPPHSRTLSTALTLRAAPISGPHHRSGASGLGGGTPGPARRLRVCVYMRVCLLVEAEVVVADGEDNDQAAWGWRKRVQRAITTRARGGCERGAPPKRGVMRTRNCRPYAGYSRVAQ
ncbi:hypothetical protein C8F04DRAFT_1275148 [Mycena alexandri]|uniref:Uncharacterized protein n=1 Tax=Mycena alexandri TaxID=1745969 RepID=A0AAD6S4F5_9AGAR|nr:hypothetical protein C8F04DRAFT_1275148 [Mycena alexandri]